jgi:hypothetical protein
MEISKGVVSDSIMTGKKDKTIVNIFKFRLKDWNTNILRFVWGNAKPLPVVF